MGDVQNSSIRVFRISVLIQVESVRLIVMKREKDQKADSARRDLEGKFSENKF